MSEKYETKEVTQWEKKGIIPAETETPTVAPDPQPEHVTPTAPVPAEESSEAGDDEA
jgi:hypothetical protein